MNCVCFILCDSFHMRFFPARFRTCADFSMRIYRVRFFPGRSIHVAGKGLKKEQKMLWICRKTVGNRYRQVPNVKEVLHLRIRPRPGQENEQKARWHEWTWSKKERNELKNKTTNERTNPLYRTRMVIKTERKNEKKVNWSKIETEKERRRDRKRDGKREKERAIHKRKTRVTSPSDSNHNVRTTTTEARTNESKR